MKVTLVRSAQKIQFWLLAIAGGLAAIQMSLTWKSLGTSPVIVVALCWGAVLSLLKEKHHTLSLESDLFSSLLGGLLLAFVLLRSLLMTSFDAFYAVSNFIAALGLALLASGVKGLRQYRQELAIVLAFNVPIGLLVEAINISPLTAQLAAFILSQLGFTATIRQGVNIVLPSGAVEVNPGCAGLEGIIRLLQLTVLFLAMFPTNLAKKLLVPTVAVLIAFTVNALRVALMAILVAYSDRAAFNYWHLGPGSEIFILIASLLFGLFCYFVRPKTEPSERKSMEAAGP